MMMSQSHVQAAVPSALTRPPCSSHRPNIRCNVGHGRKPAIAPIRATENGGQKSPQQVKTLEPILSTGSMALNALESCENLEGLKVTQEYYFSAEQLGVIKHLRRDIYKASQGFAAVGITSLGLSILTATEGRDTEVIQGLTIGDFAFLGDSAIMWLLAKYALEPFDKMITSKNHQMQYLFNGVSRLDLIFQQLSITAFSVSTVTALDAAVTYPPIVKGLTLGFFGLASLRSFAMWWALSRHATSNEEVVRTLGQVRGDVAVGKTTSLPQGDTNVIVRLWDRLAILLAFGYLVNHEESLNTKSCDDADAADDCVYEEYVFSASEERVLKSMLDSASTATLMVCIQAFAVLMLTVAEAGVDETPRMISDGINFSNKAITAYYMFAAISGADKALHCQKGGNVDHLIESLGEKGWSGLFEHLGKLAIAISIANTLGFFLPFIEHDVLFAGLADGASEAGAEEVLEVLQMAINTVEQI